MSLASQYICLPVGYEDSFEMFSLVQDDPVHYHMWHRLLTLAYRAHDRGNLRDERGRRVSPQRFSQIYFRSAQSHDVERCERFFSQCVDLGLLKVTPEEVYRVVEWEAFLRKRVVLTTEELAEQREKEREKKARYRARKRAEREDVARPKAAARCASATQQKKQVSTQRPQESTKSPPLSTPVPRQNEKENENRSNTILPTYPTEDLTRSIETKCGGVDGRKDKVFDLDSKGQTGRPRGQPSNRRTRTTQSFADVMRGAADG